MGRKEKSGAEKKSKSEKRRKRGAISLFGWCRGIEKKKKVPLDKKIVSGGRREWCNMFIGRRKIVNNEREKTRQKGEQFQEEGAI